MKKFIFLQSLSIYVTENIKEREFGSFNILALIKTVFLIKGCFLMQMGLSAVETLDLTSDRHMGFSRWGCDPHKSRYDFERKDSSNEDIFTDFMRTVPADCLWG